MTRTVQQLNQENSLLQEKLRGMDKSSTEANDNTHNIVDKNNSSYSVLIQNLNLSSNSPTLPSINENSSLSSAVGSNNQDVSNKKPLLSQMVIFRI